MIKYSLIVFFKEMKCIFRDKKTFIIGVLIPLILMPAMIALTDFSFNKNKNAADNLIISISNTDNSFYKFCHRCKGITVKDVKDAPSAIKNGEIAIYVLIDQDLDQKILSGEPFKFNIDYNQSSLSSVAATRAMAQYELDFRNLVMNKNFSSLEELNQAISEYSNFKTESTDSSISNSLLYLVLIAPLMIMIYCFVGSSSTALELSTGEKERSTWEPLLSTGISRRFIIVGKLLAATFTGFMSTLSTIIGFLGYLYFEGTLKSSGISWAGMIILIIISLFISAFISSISLALGIYSKSNKEAQTYFVPVLAFIVAPGYMATSMDVRNVGLFELSIPMLNIVCVIKESLIGVSNCFHLFVVSLWVVIYTFIVYKIACRLIEKESIIFKN